LRMYQKGSNSLVLLLTKILVQYTYKFINSLDLDM
jgi:hypothetical protein